MARWICKTDWQCWYNIERIREGHWWHISYIVNCKGVDAVYWIVVVLTGRAQEICTRDQFNKNIDKTSPHLFSNHCHFVGSVYNWSWHCQCFCLNNPLELTQWNTELGSMAMNRTRLTIHYHQNFRSQVPNNSCSKL